MISPRDKLKVVVLASGDGSNFQALVDATHRGTLDVHITHLITNNPGAKVLARASAAKVPTTILPNHADRHAYATALVRKLRMLGAELICLAGFMRLLDPAVIRAYPLQVMNIHPALLPAFPGLHAIRQALAAGVTETGCTVHFVDEGVDTGPIILQERVAIQPGDTEGALAMRIHAAEHRLYPRAVQLFAQERLEVKNRLVIVRPA